MRLVQLHLPLLVSIHDDRILELDGMLEHQLREPLSNRLGGFPVRVRDGNQITHDLLLAVGSMRRLRRKPRRSVTLGREDRAADDRDAGTPEKHRTRARLAGSAA
jgi:hypothetical protein